MAQTGNEVIEVRDLSKGLTTYEGDTGVPDGFYVDAQNVHMPSKTPETVGGLTKLTTTAAPDSRNVLWFEPFASPSTGTHSDVAHSDVAHADVAHSDVAHGDVAHADAGHSDVAHSDTHSDTHSDVAHSDVAHGDVAHSDAPDKAHVDTPHTDSHGDTAHSDTHSDTHTDVAHTDAGHADTAHTDTAHSDGAHSDTAHTDVAHSDTITNASLIVALDRGADTDGDGSGIWEYNPNTDTWTHLWTYCFTTAGETARYRFNPPYFSSIPFRSRLFWTFSGVNDTRQDIPAATNVKLTDETLNATSDNPLKHDGTYVSPLGAAAYSFDVASTITGTAPTDQRVATMEASEAAGWTNGTALATGGNRKGGTQGRELTAATGNMFLAYTALASGARDFTTGLLGAPNFGNSDWFVIWFKPTTVTGTPTLTFRFGDNAGANRFDFTTAALTLTANRWYEYRVRRSQFATTGAPNFNNIQRFTIFVNTAGNTLVFDEAYWEYANAPTARGAVIEMYNQQCVLGDLYDAKTSIKYSNVGSPDYFDPAIGVARFDGGRLTLGEQDRITALWTYFDELIVGKGSSAWTFSGTGANVSISALPLTIGIAGHRAVVETPWSLHYYYDGNIFGARLTSRGLVSTNVNSLLADMDVSRGFRHTSLRNDPTHTVRWSFRRNADLALSQNGLGLLYDYQLDAWLGTYTPKIRHYTQWVNYNTGKREILVAQYDGHIRRADIGTSFDGTAIESYVTLPWMQPTKGYSGKTEAGIATQRIQPRAANVVQWMDVTTYLKGTASVLVEARFADEPHEFDTATFSTFGTIQATPDGDKGYVYLGKTARFIQLRFRATSLSFQLTMPILVSYNLTARRV